MDKSWQDSVVLIMSSDPSEQSFGTGFVIHEDKQATYLLTCTHVVREVGGPGKIQINGTQARVVASSPEKRADLAILCIERLPNMPPLPLYAASEKGKPFNTAGFQSAGKQIVIRELQVTLGKQVGVQMIGQAGRIKAWDLKITDSLHHLQDGYSGSPVVDESDHVVAVVNTREGQGFIGTAISIEALEKIWSEMPPGLFVPSTVGINKADQQVEKGPKYVSRPPAPTGQENLKDRILYIHSEPEEYGKCAARGIYDLVQTWPKEYNHALARGTREEGRIDSSASFLAIWDEKQAIVFHKWFQQLRQELWGEQSEQIEEEILQKMENAKKDIQSLIDNDGANVVFAPYNADTQTCEVSLQGGIARVKYTDNTNIGITKNSVRAEVAAGSNMFARMYFKPKAQEAYALSLLGIDVQSHEQLANRSAIARAIVGMGPVYLASYAMDPRHGEHFMAKTQLINLPKHLQAVYEHHQKLSANLTSGKGASPSNFSL